MTSTIIVPLAREHKSLAAAALGRAFQDDPLQRYLVPDDRQRELRSPAHFSAILEYGLRFGDVYSTEAATHGAAVCLGPGAWEVTEENASAAGLDRLPEIFGDEGAKRFHRVLGSIDHLHKTRVPSDHLYVMVVGVCPSAQGQGLGKALIEPILERSATEGKPVYLETAQPRNVEFYKHLGFEVLDEFNEPESGLTLWTFRRDPEAE